MLADDLMEHGVLGVARPIHGLDTRHSPRCRARGAALGHPRVVVAEPVGQLDLGERILEEPVLALVRPRPRQLLLVEDPEFHGE